MLLYFSAICNILWTFGILYDHLVYFGFIWYIFPVLVLCTKKNLATLMSSQKWTISLVKQGKSKVGVVPADGLGHLQLKTMFLY
jgi:hypothetical protein